MATTSMTLANFRAGPNSPFQAVPVDAPKDIAYELAARYDLRGRFEPDLGRLIDLPGSRNVWDHMPTRRWRHTGSGGSIAPIGGTPRWLDMTGGGKRGYHLDTILMDSRTGGQNPDFFVFGPVHLSQPAGGVIETIWQIGDDSGLDDWLGWNTGGMLELRLGGTVVGAYAETAYNTTVLYGLGLSKATGRITLLRNGVAAVIDQPIGSHVVNGGYPVVGGYTYNANAAPWKGKIGQTDFLQAYPSAQDYATMTAPLVAEYGVTFS